MSEMAAGVLLLSFCVDPFGVTDPVVWMKRKGEEYFWQVDLSNLGSLDGIVVTFGLGELIEAAVARSAELPTTIIDIEDALRLGSQISRDQGGPREWDFWRSASRNFQSEVRALRRVLESRDHASSNEIGPLLRSGCRMLEGVWENAISLLQARGEHDRFFSYEVPVRQIFNDRQARGIGLDLGLLQAYFASVRDEKYKVYRQLAKTIGFAPVGLSARKIAACVPVANLGDFCSLASSDLFFDYLEIARERSTLAADLTEYDKSSRDIQVLARLLASGERAYPRFNCVGTVTARILVSNPLMQQLRKRYRDVIVADPGWELMYLDYSQFEPGILAAVSADGELKDAYEGGDLYEALSVAVFNCTDRRKLAKRIFLSYLYGMPQSSIASLLAGPESSDAERIGFESAVEKFFRRFAAADRFRTQLRDQLRSDGRIGTPMGNFRRRTTDGRELSPKESRWSLSQAIQGTGSLIFKEALLLLAKHFGARSIVLPMHDGVLMQFNRAEIARAEAEKVACSLMVQAFQRWCPSVRPKVAIEQFANG
jgi:hypothetical protein